MKRVTMNIRSIGAEQSIKQELKSSTINQPSFCAAKNNSLVYSPESDIFESKKKKHTGLKVVIGALAITTLMVVVDYWKFGGKHCKGLAERFSNRFKSKTESLNIKELETNVEQNKKRLTSCFSDSEAEFMQRLEHINKLPIEEQKAELDKLEQASEWYLAIKRSKTDVFPSDVQKAINDNKLIEACEKYRDYLDSLPNIFKPKNAGETFEETLKNVFETETNITKHTYDLEKESGFIMAQKNYGGFKDKVATIDGQVRKYPEEQLNTVHGILNNPQSSWGKCTKIDIGNNQYLNHGKAKSGKYCVELSFNSLEYDAGGKPIPARIFILSSNSKMTPVQKDLIKIAENPKKLDLDALNRVTEISCENKDPANMYEWKNFDYDLLLSVIQKMAK